MKDLAPVTSERLDQKLREELEQIEEAMERELRYGPTRDDPSVEAEHKGSKR